jgi:hypothetical protein
MGKLTKEEKESAIITACVCAILMLLLFVLKFEPTKELEKKKEVVVILEDGGGGGGGTTINFGDSDSGLGAKYQSDAKAQAAQAQSAPSEEVVGSDDNKAEAVANTTPVKNRDPKAQNPKPVVNNAPKTPAKPTNAALDNILGGSNTGSSGNTRPGGNQGANNGITNGAYGDGGTGGGTGGGNGSGNGSGQGPGSGSGSGGGSGSGRGPGLGGGLAGRKLVSAPEPAGCNERTDTKVVLNLTVDGTGKVLKAETFKGTTGSTCQIQQAKAVALKSKFEPSSSQKVTGTITYNFIVEKQ